MARFLLALSAALLIVPLLALSPFAPSSGASRSEVAYVVGFSSLPSERSEYAGERVVGVLDDIQAFRISAKNPRGLEERAAHDPKVSFLEEDALDYEAAYVPDDPYFAGSQWDLKSSTTNIMSAWDKTRGSASVKVCVADTGQYRRHQDFSGVRWAEWKDFVNGAASAYDDNGHGTHVTGTIGADMANDNGIAGIARVAIAGAKVLDKDGHGYSSDLAEAITWCTDIGAVVINLSLSGGYSSAVSSAVDYAWSKGVLVVGSAGNRGPCDSCVRYPAALPKAIAVACTDASNERCSFSSQGPEIDVAAPGLGILSTIPPSCGSTNCFARKSGTSMSAPHVTGLLALMKSAHPDWTAGDLRSRLLQSARDLGAAGRDPDFGLGLIRGTAVI